MYYCIVIISFSVSQQFIYYLQESQQHPISGQELSQHSSTVDLNSVDNTTRLGMCLLIVNV